MKKFFSLFISSIFYFLFSFSLVAQDTYPIQSFTRVHYYKLKAGFERPSPNNGIVLTQEQVKQLTDMLNTPETFEKPEFRCFDPNDVFIFYNDNNKKVARIDLGFKCRKVLAEPLIPAALEIGLGLTINASTALQAIVTDISKDLKMNIPDDVTQITHVVVSGDTWESIAKKYDTSAELIVAMNRKNLGWTPSEGDNITVCLHYSAYKYPSTDNIVSNVTTSNPSQTTTTSAAQPKKSVAEPKNENNHEALSLKEPVVKQNPTTVPKPSPNTQVEEQTKEQSSSSNSVVMDFKGLNNVQTKNNPNQMPAANPSDSKTENLKATTHIVQHGETLYAISRKYGKSVKEILAANGMSEPNIKMGQSLVIPK